MNALNVLIPTLATFGGVFGGLLMVFSMANNASKHGGGEPLGREQVYFALGIALNYGMLVLVLALLFSE